MHPELEFIFAEYERKFRTEITALICPRIKVKIEPVDLHPFIKSIYWRKYQEDRERNQNK